MISRRRDVCIFALLLCLSRHLLVCESNLCVSSSGIYRQTLLEKSSRYISRNASRRGALIFTPTTFIQHTIYDFLCLNSRNRYIRLGRSDLCIRHVISAHVKTILERNKKEIFRRIVNTAVNNQFVRCRNEI